MTMTKLLHFSILGLTGGLMALSSIFVVTNSLLLRFHGSEKSRKNDLAKISEMPAGPS